MKKGISYWAYMGKTYREAFGYAKKCGFDGVEVTLDAGGEITLQTTEKQILEIRKQAENSGIELYSVATSLYWDCPMSANDAQTRAKSEEIARRQIDIAALLGCDTVLVVPGLVDSETAYDTVYDRALCAMRKLAPYAEARGVTVGAENVWNRFLLSPLEFARFIDEIGSPYVKAYFDVGNVVYDGYPEQWIKVLGNRICKVHIKDYIRENRTLAGFTDIGNGDVDFGRVLSVLEDVGYDGFCTAEVFPDGDTAFETVDKAASAFEKIFG